jgi:hypothetical protein
LSEENILPWRCFHCGFETTDRIEAQGHFGDRDDEVPLCISWHDLDADGKASEIQHEHGMLLEEQDENLRLRTKIEGLEYRVEGQLSEIHSFAPFRKCDTIQQVFNVYDSMEGRALAAGEQLARLLRGAKRRRNEIAALRSTIAQLEAEVERLKVELEVSQCNLRAWKQAADALTDERIKNQSDWKQQIFSHKHLDPRCVTEGCRSNFTTEPDPLDEIRDTFNKSPFYHANDCSFALFNDHKCTCGLKERIDRFNALTPEEITKLQESKRKAGWVENLPLGRWRAVRHVEHYGQNSEDSWEKVTWTLEPLGEQEEA